MLRSNTLLFAVIVYGENAASKEANYDTSNDAEYINMCEIFQQLNFSHRQLIYFFQPLLQ